jgi:hypothetical protein
VCGFGEVVDNLYTARQCGLSGLIADEPDLVQTVQDVLQGRRPFVSAIERQRAWWHRKRRGTYELSAPSSAAFSSASRALFRPWVWLRRGLSWKPPIDVMSAARCRRARVGRWWNEGWRSTAAVKMNCRPAPHQTSNLAPSLHTWSACSQSQCTRRQIACRAELEYSCHCG